jgi:hypothetical protein
VRKHECNAAQLLALKRLQDLSTGKVFLSAKQILLLDFSNKMFEIGNLNVDLYIHSQYAFMA